MWHCGATRQQTGPLRGQQEVQNLVKWREINNLTLNASKPKELVIGFSCGRASHLPVTINSTVVEMVNSLNFLGVTITNDLNWCLNTCIIVKKIFATPFLFMQIKGIHL